MGKGGSFDFKEIEKLQKQIEQMERERNTFCEACAKELAARLLTKVIKRTPVGDHPNPVKFAAHLPPRKVEFNTKDGKHVSFTAKAKVKQVSFRVDKGLNGGTLRRGWTAQSNGSGAEGLKSRGISDYVNTLIVHHFGDTYVIEIANPVDYASYVEYGHRTANHKGWVKGHFMLTISEQQLQSQAPSILEKKLTQYLKGVFNV